MNPRVSWGHVRIPLTPLFRNTWGVAIACGYLALPWLEKEKVEDKYVVNCRPKHREWSCRAPSGEGRGELPRRCLPGALQQPRDPARRVGDSRVEIAGKAPFQQGWIRPLSENQHSLESWGERWQAELDPNNSQPQHWDSLACREADAWRCWHCIRTLWTKLSTENLHGSNWNSLLL